MTGSFFFVNESMKTLTNYDYKVHYKRFLNFDCLPNQVDALFVEQWKSYQKVDFKMGRMLLLRQGQFSTTLCSTSTKLNDGNNFHGSGAHNLSTSMWPANILGSPMTYLS